MKNGPHELTNAERVCFRNTNRRIRRRSSGCTEDIASTHSAALGFQTPHLKAKRTPVMLYSLYSATRLQIVKCKHNRATPTGHAHFCF